jgi:hypothetical protein
MNQGNTVNGDQMKESARTVKEGLEKDQATKPEESTSTLDMDQRIKLMEFAHEKTRLNGSWEDAYNKMVELLTGVPVNLPGDVLDILKKIDVGEYHLSITPFSEIHFLSPEESADLERHMNKEIVTFEKELLERLYIGALSLKMYIDASPAEAPVLWHVDNKTPVQVLPDYKNATDTIETVGKTFFGRGPKAEETPPTPKRDFSKTCPGEEQKITIIKRSDTRFTIHHKHEAFSFETYGAHSFEGVMKSVENLLNGCKPTLHDHYLKSDSKPPVHTEGGSEPKPLD